MASDSTDTMADLGDESDDNDDNISLPSMVSSRMADSMASQSRPMTSPMGKPQGGGDLFSLLRAAERRLEVEAAGTDAASSSESEDRDMVGLAQQVEEELERKSNSSKPKSKKSEGDKKLANFSSPSMKSWDASQTKDPIRLRPEDFTSASSASNSGSSNDKPTATLLNLLEKSDQAMSALQTEVLVAEHEKDKQVKIAQKQLRETKAEKAVEVQELEAEVKDLKAVEAAQREAMDERSKYTKEVKQQLEEKTALMEDHLAAVQAENEWKAQQLKAKLEAEKLHKEEIKESAANVKHALKSELQRVMQELNKSKHDVQTVINERDVVRRNEAVAEKQMQHVAENKLSQLLEESGQEIDLEEVCRNTLIQELEAMKWQMIQLKSKHAAEMGQLRLQLSSANRKLVTSESFSNSKSSVSSVPLRLTLPPGRSARSKHARYNPNIGKLASISEDSADDLSEDGSNAGSANVSSNGENDGVGDLRDFDMIENEDPKKSFNLERIMELEQQVAEERVAREKMEQTMVGKEAMIESKVARLNKLVDNKGHEAEIAEEKAAQANQEVRVVKAKLHEVSENSEDKGVKIAELREQLSENDVQKDYKDFDIERLRAEVVLIVNAKRVSERRLEDFKQIIQALEDTHQGVVSDLNQQIRVLQARNQDGGLLLEFEELRKQIGFLTEERNMLVNTLEWKEVQWRSEIEQLQGQMAADSEQMRNDYEAKLAECVSTLPVGDFLRRPS